MNLSSAMSYEIAKAMARYQATYAVATQTLAADANANDIQTTGLKIQFFDGTPVKLPADAAMDVSAEANESVTAWANNTAYSVGDIRSNSDAEGSNIRLRCTQAHTSNAINDEPLVASRWEEYWVREPHNVAKIGGTVVAAGNQVSYLVLAKRDGTLVTANIGNQINSASPMVMKIPRFDPYTYSPVGFVTVVNADPSNVYNIGNVADATNMTTTYDNLTAPIFPHLDNLK